MHSSPSHAFLSILLLLLLLLLSSTLAQNCYYPNGDVSSTDASCGPGTGMCCPFRWQCLSNGLCALPDQGLLGRYTCTDRSWKSPICPEFCTHSGSASGNEDIQQCSDGSYCCNGNGSLNCCSKSDAIFLDLGLGRPTRTILSLSPATPDAFTPLRSSPSTSSSSWITTSQPTVVTSRTSLVGTSSTTAIDETIEGSRSSNVTAGAAASPSSPNPSESTRPALGMILGLALGIPAAVLALAALLLIVHRRRRKTTLTPSSSGLSKGPAILDGYGGFAPGGRAPELDSFPVAPVRSRSGRRSELPYSPAVSSLRDSHVSPPGYSVACSPELLAVNGSSPAELWAGYVPYRPPPQNTTPRASVAPAAEGVHQEDAAITPPGPGQPASILNAEDSGQSATHDDGSRATKDDRVKSQC